MKLLFKVIIFFLKKDNPMLLKFVDSRQHTSEHTNMNFCPHRSMLTLLFT